jgi:hypothetical protein
VTFVRDATQDCAAANASATTLTATFPGGAQAAGRLLVGVAQLPTAAANVSTKGGSGFTTGFSQDDFSAASLIGVAKIATGSETGITFTHGDTAGQIRILAFVYDGALSPLAIEQPAGTADDGSQHANVTVTLAGATVGTSDLIISAASLLGTGTTPLSSNGDDHRQQRRRIVRRPAHCQHHRHVQRRHLVDQLSVPDRRDHGHQSCPHLPGLERVGGDRLMPKLLSSGRYGRGRLLWPQPSGMPNANHGPRFNDWVGGDKTSGSVSSDYPTGDVWMPGGVYYLDPFDLTSGGYVRAFDSGKPYNNWLRIREYDGPGTVIFDIRPESRRPPSDSPRRRRTTTSPAPAGTRCTGAPCKSSPAPPGR